jgi:hypothetical protein
MTLDQDLRAALKPLDDQGLIHLVEVNTSLVGTGEFPNPLATTGVMILLNTVDPEAHREEIEHLLHAHGITNIEVVLESNPPKDDG